MQTQDQGYSENTQITKSGRKLKFGLLFVGDDVPSDQLEDYEVAITEDGLGLRKIQVFSNKELYGEVLEIMRWTYQEFLKKRNENTIKKNQNIEVEDFKLLNQSIPQSKQEQILNFDQILDLRIYQGYGQTKIENFKECIQYFFNQRNKSSQIQFVKYLHQKQKLPKILSIIPQIPRKEAFEEHEKKLQEVIQRQEYLLKNQIADKQSLSENKQQYKFLSFDEQFKKFIAENSSSSSSEPSPQTRNNSSPNKIYSQINTQIAKTNFASEKKLSRKEQSIEKFENYQKNNFNKILKEDQTLQKNGQPKKVQPKVQFASEIIKKDEMKLKQQQQQNKLQVQQYQEWKGCEQIFEQNANKFNYQFEESEIITNQTAKSKKRFVIKQDQIQQQDYYSIPQKELGVPKFCGESLSCYLGNKNMNQKNENQEIQYSEQKHISSIKEQQSTSINLPNKGKKVFQQKFQEEAVKQIHPNSTINFSEFNNNIQCCNQKDHDYDFKNQIRQVSNSKQQFYSKLQDQQIQNQQHYITNKNEYNFTQTNNFVQQKQQQNAKQLENYDMFNQAKNTNVFKDSHFMSLQKCNIATQKQNPFKSMQKKKYCRESSSETTQNSSKASSILNRIQSQLKIGDKVQKCGKKFVFSQILKQQNSEVIEDDIVEVEKI
ncbi:hypothetical protein ABPG72_019172 [Tetrahymena utriculariae]